MPPKKKGKAKEAAKEADKEEPVAEEAPAEKKAEEKKADEPASAPMEVDEGAKKESESKDEKEEKPAETKAETKEEEKAAEADAAPEGEGKEEVKEEAKEETKEEAKEEAKEETKEEAKEEAKAEEAEEATAEAEEAEEEPAEPKELEEDSAADERPKVEGGKVGLSLADSTLNVMPVAGGSLIMSLTEGGMQYLLAGVRANTGVKSGRYMFELKMIESLPQMDTSDNGRAPSPHNLVRVGFSLAKSSLYLTSEPESICFDTEGYFYAGRKRSRVAEKFGVEQTVAVLLNLQEGSPNVNTVSLFIDGERMSKPQALPEHLVGKALYPTVTYKNVTLSINFGPVPKVPLPFSCRMLSEAAAADVELATEPSASAVCEVLFPVGLPDHGVFDWVDDFLEKHPAYTELSNRKILDWASKSGVWRPKGYTHRSSNDQPDMGFGIPLLDDNSVSRVLSHVAPVMRRDYIITELKGNLIAEERKKALLRFGGPQFRKVAAVLVGEPNEEYKTHIKSMMLSEKVAKADAEKKKKANEEERKRLQEERRKRTTEARKAASAASKDGDKPKAEEAADGEKAEEAKAEDKAEDKAEEKAEETPMEVEEEKPALTEEEEKLWYRKLDTPDMSQKALAQSYAKFTLPTTEEGFDEIKFIWQPAAESTTFVTNWVREMKRTQKAEELKPSAWFKKELTKWKNSFNDWKKKATEFKDPVKRKLAAQKRQAEAAKKKAEAEKKADGEKKEGEEEAEEAPEEKAEPMEISFADLNPLEVKDVTDVGNGEPLFSNFVYEDWAMLSIRFELFLLLHAFRKDLDDSDRPSFPEAHLAYYYEKYYNKEFRLKTFAQESFADFIELVQDAVTINESSGLLEGILAEDTPHDQFVRLAEEHRRDRERRVDAGDETAKLKFNRPAPPPRDAPRPPPSGRSGKDGSKGKSDRGGKDSGKGKDRRPPPPSDQRKGKDSGKGSKDSGKSRNSGYNSSSYDSGKSRHSSSYDSGKSRPSYNDKSHYSSGSSYDSYGSQKRSYAAPAGAPHKQARTSSYSGGKSGYSSGGSKGGGYSGYRR